MWAETPRPVRRGLEEQSLWRSGFGHADAHLQAWTLTGGVAMAREQSPCRLESDIVTRALTRARLNSVKSASSSMAAPRVQAC